jgi:HAD superfamily hydrolase (TIGR01509 family)
MGSVETTNSFCLVIFDCDGVLIDSEMISARVLIAALAKAGVTVSFEYFEENFLGRSWPTVAADINRSHGIFLGADFEDQFRNDLLNAFERELESMDGVQSVLTNLAIPYCVATSSSPARAARSLAIAGLTAHFGERVFTASQVAKGKPAPDLYLFAARQMGVAPRNCLVIEDSFTGILSAQSAGMTVWRFTGGSHLRGRWACHRAQTGSIPVFDNWAQFLEMAPQLKRGG